MAVIGMSEWRLLLAEQHLHDQVAVIEDGEPAVVAGGAGEGEQEGEQEGEHVTQ